MEQLDHTKRVHTLPECNPVKRARLSFLHRYLTRGRCAAMTGAVGLWYSAPAIVGSVTRLQAGAGSIMKAVGLVFMLQCAVARVREEHLGEVCRNCQILGLSPVHKWVMGPVLTS